MRALRADNEVMNIQETPPIGYTRESGPENGDCLLATIPHYAILTQPNASTLSTGPNPALTCRTGGGTESRSVFLFLEVSAGHEGLVEVLRVLDNGGHHEPGVAVSFHRK